MEQMIAILVGVLFGAAAYMMLHRGLFDLVIGLQLLSYGANLLIFVNGGLVRESPPVIDPDHAANLPMADALPQAMILTAIVISFGILAFTLALFRKTHLELKSDDTRTLEELR